MKPPRGMLSRQSASEEISVMVWPPGPCRCGRMAAALKIRRGPDDSVEVVCLDCENAKLPPGALTLSAEEVEKVRIVVERLSRIYERTLGLGASLGDVEQAHAVLALLEKAGGR